MILGASGKTGKHVVEQALRKGYSVTSVVRKPDLFALKHPRLKLVKADVINPSAYIDQAEQCSAVISCLGTGTKLTRTTIYSEGLQAITTVMSHLGIRRLICLSAGGLESNKEMGILMNVVTKVVLQRILKNVYADMRVMEHMLETAPFEWTIIRPARLTDGKSKGHYRTAINDHISKPRTISRADVAQYLLTILNDSKTFKAKVEIAY